MDEAELCYRRALALYHHQGAQERIVNVSSNLGNLALQRYDLDAAADHYNSAMVRARKIGNPSVEMSPVFNAANMHHKRWRGRWHSGARTP